MSSEHVSLETQRKIEILQSDGKQEKQRYKKETDIWTKLRGDEEFKNLNSTKVKELVGVALAECFGVAIVVALGCSSTITNMQGSAVTHLNVVITFAFAISIAVTTFVHISGCHINPAISLSAVIFGHLSIPKFLVYVVAQCVGACIGIFIVKIVSPGACTSDSFCVTLPSPDISAGQATLVEACLTGVVIWIVNAAWDRRCQDKHDSLAVKFGLAVVALALPGGKYTGASLSPARSFGPALISGNWTNHWVYWVGPMGGSIVASAVYKTFWAEPNLPQPVSTRSEEPAEEQPLNNIS